MKVYMLHSADARKAAKDVRRFDMSGGKLLLFREPGDDGDYEGLKNAFGSSEVYECPGAEHVLMADTLKAAVSPKDSLYLIGPALTGFFEASRDRVLDMASAVYVSKTLNTEGKRPVQKKKRKREVSDASDVLSELLALNLCQAERKRRNHRARMHRRDSRPGCRSRSRHRVPARRGRSRRTRPRLRRGCKNKGRSRRRNSRAVAGDAPSMARQIMGNHRWRMRKAACVPGYWNGCTGILRIFALRKIRIWLQ